MKPLRKKTAQSSLEFVSIASFMFLVFIATFMTIEGRMSGVYKERLYKSMGELNRLIASEIRMADFAPGSYERDFFLPSVVGGYNYSINITDTAEITIRTEGLDFVVFLDHNISGDIGKGRNRITKVNGVINISNLCLEGAGSDDSDCGIVDCSGWYQQGTDMYGTQTCYNKTDINYARCIDQGECQKPNSGPCDFRPNREPGVYACSECQEIIGCSGNDVGHCSNLEYGADCDEGIYHRCDGNGHCNVP